MCLQFVFFSLPGLQHKTISCFSETISKRRSIEILLHFFNLIGLKLDSENQMSYPWHMHRSVRSAAKQLHSLDQLGANWSDRTGWRRIERREIKSSEKRSIRIERIQKPYCALWAYVSCHVYFSVLFSKLSKRRRSKHCNALFFDSGELAVTSLAHSRASRLWVWLYTSVRLGSMLVYRKNT